MLAHPNTVCSPGGACGTRRSYCLPSGPCAFCPEQCWALPLAGPTLIRESQQGTLTRFLPKIDATWHELAVLGAATLDEGATVCVVPLLRYDDSEGVRTSVRVVTAAPPPTLQQWMLSHADGKLPLDAWVRPHLPACVRQRVIACHVQCNITSVSASTAPRDARVCCPLV